MTVRVLVIGIGSGSPGHLTGDAVDAMRSVDVFLVADKGPARHDLAELRRRLCEQVIDHDRYSFVEVADPPRDPGGDYDAAVADWHARRAAAYAQVIATEVPPGGSVGFLVWGDPVLYDSTIRLVDAVAEHGVDCDLTVVPGISSVSLLAARHRIVLNRVGLPVHITTGRRLLAEYRAELGDVVVMLDGSLRCGELVVGHPDLEIFWGAQLGLPSERLLRGCLAEVIDDLRAARRSVQKRDGWVFDLYLLRPST